MNKSTERGSLLSATVLLALASLSFLNSCKSEDDIGPVTSDIDSSFYFGADLSYVNQILDHGGIYKEENVVKNPYTIFEEHGTNLVRLRLWHNPTWTKEVYGEDGTQLYNDFDDVKKSIQLSKAEGMEVLLDFHYSDIWADPGNQKIPAAWREITTLTVLKDSVYNYTFKILSRLKSAGLMPELVQLGNEINCGLFYTDKPASFPSCDACNGQWAALGGVLNSAIDAVRDVEPETKIILHVADPKNVEWWFDNITTTGGVSDFDVVGFSYYPIWHTTVSIDALSDKVQTFGFKYGREVMMLETAFPWTPDYNDDYTNSFGGTSPFTSYPYSRAGQLALLKKLTQEMLDGEGTGLIYWEPGWITSNMKDLWGTGSTWENNAFFDFNGNLVEGADYMRSAYNFKRKK